MVYTVKKLSGISGVSVRALHYYEEENLLKPAYYGSNGYRYYEKKELLRLQQILFFKELGFTLKQIRNVLGRSDFDQIAALYSHKAAMQMEWEKLGRLMKTIEQTIQHLKGKKKMEDKEIFDGFISIVAKGKGSETYFSAEEIVLQSVKNPSKEKKDPEFIKEVNRTASGLFKKLAQCIEKGTGPASDETQKIIRKHYAFVGRYHNATPDVYKAMAQLYKEHPEFRKQLTPFHPQLADYMHDAMVSFANGL